MFLSDLSIAVKIDDESFTHSKCAQLNKSAGKDQWT